MHLNFGLIMTISAICGAVGGIAAFVVKVTKPLRYLIADIKHNKSTVYMLLKYDMRHICSFAFAQGQIDPVEREDLLFLYDEYKDCGGNGSMEDMIAKAKALPIVGRGVHLSEKP